MLCEVSTSDGIRLHGYLHLPTDPSEVFDAFDAVVLIHGTGSNFYSSTLWNGLIPSLASWGLATLSINTRGHDGMYVAHAQGGRRSLGAAFEIFDESCLDVAAWLLWLTERGYQRIALVGHSAGAVKAVYSQAKSADPVVKGVLAISPPRLSYREFCASGAAHGFNDDYERARQCVAEGRPDVLLDVRFPLPYTISARGFLDKYGPEERYNFLNFATGVGCPQLFTFGGLEVQNSAAFRGLPDALEQLAARAAANIDVSVVAGADHVYSGCHGELATRLRKWFKRQSGKTSQSS